LRVLIKYRKEIKERRKPLKNEDNLKVTKGEEIQIKIQKSTEDRNNNNKNPRRIKMRLKKVVKESEKVVETEDRQHIYN